MGVGAIAALVFGRLLDKVGLPILILAFFLSAFFAPFVFLGGASVALIGMTLWGIGMGAQDSLLKAVLTKVVSAGKRSTAFGLFDTSFGIAWFLGSAAMGVLYDKSISTLIVFSVVAQLAALPVLFWGRREARKAGT
jgi:predicted MFS family arabinose efflux permease